MPGSLLDLCQFGAGGSAAGGRIGPEAAAHVRYFALRAVLAVVDGATEAVAQGTRAVASRIADACRVRGCPWSAPAPPGGLTAQRQAEEVDPAVQRAFSDHADCGSALADGDAMGTAMLASWVDACAEGGDGEGAPHAPAPPRAKGRRQPLAPAPELVAVAPRPVRHGGRAAQAREGLAAILTAQVQRARGT